MEKYGFPLDESNGKYAIMDMGNKYPVDIGLEMTKPGGGTTTSISRYGVWVMSGRTAKEVVDTGNDLKKLQKKYNVPDNMVFKIKK